ncbi:AraC-type DNA-binding protein [Pedobacter westerhofensis]|uniref:AraC-type DNA-binding protein n=1 Tax=Pedobacter westerhofensis TaxID=425512 RepID=A0A521B560_9SPHI|nr:AraC family transcriptional regulator [Pedobacter westerhofensis]SMO42196.1 AraC-type DNA-binding protein [Pedobacter westerhofensis]
MKSDKISLHQDELDASGVDVLPVSEAGYTGPLPHRDDHYMFLIQEGGSFTWEVDYKEMILDGPSLCYIAPGQVHRYINFEHSEGWLVFADSRLIPGQYREIFDVYLNAFQNCATIQSDPVFRIVTVLDQMLKQESLPLLKPLTETLIATLSGMIASQILQNQPNVRYSGGHKHSLVIHFKSLVREKFKELKQVKAYASLVHITPLYLNEAVKEITGFPASYWINQEILLEAKRMLYYTSRNVKQIAYDLGYEDHAYFSRFFKKHTGITAMDFRNINHQLSNQSH